MTSGAGSLAGRTVVVSGGSRGIGRYVARELGRRGAAVVVLGDDGGAVATVVREVEEAGGRGCGVPVDLRNADDLAAGVAAAVRCFGGIDACVNTGSALALAGTGSLSVEGFDLLQQVNVRGTYLMTRECLPHLRASDAAHVLTLAPPLNLAPHWLGSHPAYTVSKYAMTLLALGWAEELAPDGIASNTLWPERALATLRVADAPGAASARWARDARIVADAAATVLAQDPREVSGLTLLDAEVLRAVGVDDLAGYGGRDAPPGLFLEPAAGAEG